MVLSKIKQEAEPQEGDYKIEMRFAWWPKEVDGYKIWMERYKKVYEWRIKDRSIYSLAARITFRFPNCGDWDLIKEQRIINENSSLRQ